MSKKRANRINPPAIQPCMAAPMLPPMKPVVRFSGLGLPMFSLETNFQVWVLIDALRNAKLIWPGIDEDQLLGGN